MIDMILVSQFPLARHRLRLQARRAWMKLRKSNPPWRRYSKVNGPFNDKIPHIFITSDKTVDDTDLSPERIDFRLSSGKAKK